MTLQMIIVKKLYVWRVTLGLYAISFLTLMFVRGETVRFDSIALSVALSVGGLLVIRSYFLEKRIILGKFNLDVNQVWRRQIFTLFSIVLLIACLAIISGFR